LDAAVIVRDTLAKSLYAGMFHELIKTMNSAMKAPRHTELTLGTLDIYGFEILAKNSLEQFLINYVNEKVLIKLYMF
jgi:myosin heavy subunit